MKLFFKFLIQTYRVPLYQSIINQCLLLDPQQIYFVYLLDPQQIYFVYLLDPQQIYFVYLLDPQQIYFVYLLDPQQIYFVVHSTSHISLVLMVWRERAGDVISACSSLVFPVGWNNVAYTSFFAHATAEDATFGEIPFLFISTVHRISTSPTL